MKKELIRRIKVITDHVSDPSLTSYFMLATTDTANDASHICFYDSKNWAELLGFLNLFLAEIQIRMLEKLAQHERDQAEAEFQTALDSQSDDVLDLKCVNSKGSKTIQ